MIAIHMPSRGTCRGRQTGASLIVALLMMTVVLMLGLSATHMALQGERSARNMRDRQIAIEAAQAALLDARREIFVDGVRLEKFSDVAASDFGSDCNPGSATNVGLCDFRQSDGMGWLQVNFDEPDSDVITTAYYGQFTSATMEVGKGSLPSQKPRYIIDVLNYERESFCADCPAEQKKLYRVTAVGFGVRDTTRVMLQAVFSKES